MNNNNLTSDEITTIVKFIKNKLRKFGLNYKIEQKDLTNLTPKERNAFDHLKLKFGKNYIDEINNISKEYIEFKGGVTADQLIAQRERLNPVYERVPMPYNRNIGRIITPIQSGSPT